VIDYTSDRESQNGEYKSPPSAFHLLPLLNVSGIDHDSLRTMGNKSGHIPKQAQHDSLLTD
jgi:hypothetical protein